MMIDNSQRTLAAIEWAKQCRTYKKIDRSRQYGDKPEHRSVTGLLRSDNYLWKELRLVKLQLKFAWAFNGALISILGLRHWEGIKILIDHLAR